MMRALLDVNVLIALLDPDHSLHLPATNWFSVNARNGWASCPITQNGCVRVMSGPGYPGALPVQAVVERLAMATKTRLHEFWPDGLSLLDPASFDPSRIHGPRQITDLYLLALAVKHRGSFVTFDRLISTDAVKRAAKAHLVRL
jgi:toxin-antitoxin system PIN domain toxin